MLRVSLFYKLMLELQSEPRAFASQGGLCPRNLMGSKCSSWTQPTRISSLLSWPHRFCAPCHRPRGGPNESPLGHWDRSLLRSMNPACMWLEKESYCFLSEDMDEGHGNWNRKKNVSVRIINSEAFHTNKIRKRNYHQIQVKQAELI